MTRPISIAIGKTLWGEEVYRYFASVEELQAAAQHWRNRTLGGYSQNGLSEADWEEARAIIAAAREWEWWEGRGQ